MKRNLSTLITLIVPILLFIASASFAQDKFKLGSVPDEDLKMTVYSADTSAIAVVLYENCVMWYTVINDFAVVKDYTVRIKIMKTGGLDYADFSIPFRYGDSNESREMISGISGNIFNIDENGKVERTKLSKDYITEEKTTEYFRRKKIAFPNARVGSIVELKYQITSPYSYNIDDYIFQRSIPVRYSAFTITVPEYFIFTKNTTGYENIKYTEKNENAAFLIGGANSLTCTAKKMTFETANLPAMKSDDYVLSRYDFLSKVTFDYAGLQIPGKAYRNFATTWGDIDKRLIESSDFGKQLNHSNLLKNELAALLKPEMNDNQKVTAILNLVKNKIKWDSKDALWVSNVKKALKEGVGSSAEMNALLICLLKDAGYEAYPVVMSLRSNGRVFINQPSIKKLDYFVVAVQVNNKPMFLDASSRYNSLNGLPIDCLVENARTIQKDKPSAWVDLQNIKKNMTVNSINVGFNEENVLSGEVKSLKVGAPCVNYCLNIDHEDSIDEYKQKLESRRNISITDYQVAGNEQSTASTRETYTFKDNNITLGDDHIYINSLIFPFIEENPFKAETRNLPVEFSYPYEHVQSIIINIPEGYTVEELPKSEKIVLNNDDISYIYLVKQNEGSIQIDQKIILKSILYAATDYQNVRDFWAIIANKNAEQIVLKKL